MSALFAAAPQKGRYDYIGNIEVRWEYIGIRYGTLELYYFHSVIKYVWITAKFI